MANSQLFRARVVVATIINNQQLVFLPVKVLIFKQPRYIQQRLKIKFSLRLSSLNKRKVSGILFDIHPLQLPDVTREKSGRILVLNHLEKFST